MSQLSVALPLADIHIPLRLHLKQFQVCRRQLHLLERVFISFALFLYDYNE
jgi:hypothetical protein